MNDIEKQIRKELNNVSKWRVTMSDTEFVTLNSVKRILNLVFRGSRCLDPKDMEDREDIKNDKI